MERSYEEYRELINKHLLDFIPSIDTKSISLYESMKYSLIAGGKRLRPVLLLAACDFAGGNINEAIPYAVALEYIHTYSLIHDDLPAMDNDDLRRGIPTNHRVYGEALAILAGDGLLTTAFETMNRDMMMYLDDQKRLSKRIKAINEIAKGAGVRGMVAGQVSDMENEDSSVSNEMLEYIHLNKTGALIKAALKSGLYLGNPTEIMLEDFDIFAENLGLAYQIADDILDETGDQELLGKEVHHDAKDNKNTYTSINGIEKAKEKLEILTENAVRSISEYYDNAEFFRNLVLELKDRQY